MTHNETVYMKDYYFDTEEDLELNLIKIYVPNLFSSC